MALIHKPDHVPHTRIGGRVSILGDSPPSA